MKPIQNPAVAAKFHNYPPQIRPKLMALRKIILETAANTAEVGEIEETLKWGEPAYLTSQSGSGSTIRIPESVSPARKTLHPPGATASRRGHGFRVLIGRGPDPKSTRCTSTARRILSTLFEQCSRRTLNTEETERSFLKPTCPYPPTPYGSVLLQRSRTTAPNETKRSRHMPELTPNPSLKRSANGRPPGPVWRYAVHFRQPGPGVLPLAPA